MSQGHMMRQPDFRRTFYRHYVRGIALFLLIVVFFIGYKMYQLPAEEWERKYSAYETKHEYFTAGYARVFRKTLLKLGMSDENAIYRFWDSIHYNAYSKAIAKIPENDGERFVWEHNYYLHPYLFASTPRDKIHRYDPDELVERALIIASKLPYAGVRNPWVDVHDRYEVAAESLKFVTKYADKSISQAQLLQAVIASADNINSMEKEWQFNNIAHRGQFGSYNTTAIGLSSAFVLYWSEKNLPCDDPIVRTYTNIRAKFFSRMSRALLPEDQGLLEHSPLHKDIDKIDAKLREKCNVNFNISY